MGLSASSTGAGPLGATVPVRGQTAAEPAAAPLAPLPRPSACYVR